MQLWNQWLSKQSFVKKISLDLDHAYSQLNSTISDRNTIQAHLSEVFTELDQLKIQQNGGRNRSLELSDEDAGFNAIWSVCRPYTMTSFERGLALYRAVRYIVYHNIPGAFVECGVWRGGSSMIAMMTLASLGIANRQFFLFDTFDGMTEAGDFDVDLYGNSAKELLHQEIEQKNTSEIWAYASIEEVKANVSMTGYSMDAITFMKGDVREYLDAFESGPIALLRLDTEFYDSTLRELEVLYPRLVQYGVLIVDDFGYWQGARKAVTEYFSGKENAISPPFFHRIDETGRLIIRNNQSSFETDARYDYLPPGLIDANLGDLFPTMITCDTTMVRWDYFRTTSPHIWRIDSRNTHDALTGVLTVEEASLLYNNARTFAGRQALEIGCHFGWSTAHILAAGMHISAIDPSLHWPDQRAAVEETLRRISQDKFQFRLIDGFSPSEVPRVRALCPEPWSFVFIDGDHQGDAPRLDAEIIEQYCSTDACIMFHDVNAPPIANALRYLNNNGWEVGIYNTMQLIGIAWRGNFSPSRHIADPKMPKPYGSHLTGLPIISD